jgi:hypothetical protein
MCFNPGLSLHHFMRRRLTFDRHLQDSNSALTTTVYFRLMAMAVVQMFWLVLITVVNMWFTYRDGLRDWINWQNVHFNFSRVGLFPTLLIPPSVLRWAYFSWWSLPVSSVIFFIFFAFGQDALKEYAACFHWIQRVIFRRKSAKSKTSFISYVDLLLYQIYYILTIYIVATFPRKRQMPAPLPQRLIPTPSLHQTPRFLRNQN